MRWTSAERFVKEAQQFRGGLNPLPNNFRTSLPKSRMSPWLPRHVRGGGGQHWVASVSYTKTLLSSTAMHVDPLRVTSGHPVDQQADIHH
jgi:hypothetical protein